MSLLNFVRLMFYLNLELIHFVCFKLELFLVIGELAKLPLELYHFPKVFSVVVRSLILEVARTLGASARLIVRD